MKDTGNSTELPIIELARRIFVPVQERVPHEILFIFAFARDVREELLAHLLDEPSQYRWERSIWSGRSGYGRLRLEEVRTCINDIFYE